ncbi:hypothetical protein ILYODFUR_023507 [Ilyodon furcidens]|uniref:Uncharacterized protein n=1 Tax=Ilyodon furcidens TaxID=33524 RepID=A0ABV0SQF4_9TELE
MWLALKKQVGKQKLWSTPTTEKTRMCHHESGFGLEVVIQHFRDNNRVYEEEVLTFLINLMDLIPAERL